MLNEAKTMLSKANWIWLEQETEQNTYLDFKQHFTPTTRQKTLLELSVDGNYAVYLNHRFVNSGQYPDYPGYKVYDQLDLSPYLEDGQNELLIRAYWPGQDFFSYRREQPGLIFAVFQGDAILAKSGEETVAAKCAAFLSGAQVPLITGQLGYSYGYDARLARETGGGQASLVDKKATLFPRPIPKVEIEERLPVRVINFGTFQERPYECWGQRMQNAALAAKFWMPGPLMTGDQPLSFAAPEDDGMYWIIDLGSEQVGYLDLDITLPADSQIIVGYGEHLEDLRVRAFVGKRNFAIYFYGVKGRNHFYMPMRRLGLRYLQLHIYAHEATLHYAGIRPTIYPLQLYPLKPKDLLHRKIYEVCVQTLRNCMHDHYEDTPWREQGLYTMDSRNEMLCGYDVFHETAFPKACLRLINLSVREDGMAELCSPARASITIPSFSAIYLVQLWEYLSYSKDREFLKEMLPVAERIANAFAARIDPETGLLAAFQEKKYWNYYEWQDGLSGSCGVSNLKELTYDAPLCAFVSLGFQAMEKIYQSLGDGAHAEKSRRRWEALNQRMEETFWNGGWYSSFCRVQDQTLFHDCQLTQALMVCCGAVPSEKREGVLQLLKNDRLLPITLSYSIFKYDALMTNPGNFSWMMEDIASVWGTMLFQGATTFWETANGAPDFHNAGSLCHGWSAVPLHLYHHYGLPDA